MTDVIGTGGRRSYAVLKRAGAGAYTAAVIFAAVSLIASGCIREKHPENDNPQLTGSGISTALSPTGTPGTAERGEDFVPENQSGRNVDVQLLEYRIQMPDTIPPGDTIFLITNAGKEKHGFELQGYGLDAKVPEEVEPSQTRRLEIDLQPGTYTVSSPAGSDVAKGMKTTLNVVKGAPAPPATPPPATSGFPPHQPGSTSGTNGS
ncbi:MAG: hypothetical protein WBX15_07950 [Thermoanaerobaculia bacterium]